MKITTDMDKIGYKETIKGLKKPRVLKTKQNTNGIE